MSHGLRLLPPRRERCAEGLGAGRDVGQRSDVDRVARRPGLRDVGRRLLPAEPYAERLEVGQALPAARVHDADVADLHRFARRSRRSKALLVGELEHVVS